LFVLRNKKRRGKNTQADFQTCAQILDSDWLDLSTGVDLIGPYEDTACRLPSAEEPRERPGTAGGYFLKAQGGH